MACLNTQELLERLDSIGRSMEEAASSMDSQVIILERATEELSQARPSLTDFEGLQRLYLETISNYAAQLQRISNQYANELREYSYRLERISEQYAREVRSWSEKTDKESSRRFIWAQIIAAAAVVVSIIALVVTLINN